MTRWTSAVAKQITKPIVGTFQYHLRRRLLRDYAPHVQLSIDAGRFQIRTAQSGDDLEQVLLFRFEVFHREGLGARAKRGIDLDRFDLNADHLMITDRVSGQLIGTYRLLCSKWVTEFYSESEFSMKSVTGLNGVKVELGRACVHRDFRDGMTIQLLWRGIAAYIHETKADYAFGCASVKTECSDLAASIFGYMIKNYRFEDGWCIPLPSYRMEGFRAGVRPSSAQEVLEIRNGLPPLLKSYLNAGAKLASEPALDRDFECIDFLMILEVSKLTKLVERRFFAARGTP
jgi:putative hemolysin